MHVYGLLDIEKKFSSKSSHEVSHSKFRKHYTLAIICFCNAIKSVIKRQVLTRTAGSFILIISAFSKFWIYFYIFPTVVYFVLKRHPKICACKFCFTVWVILKRMCHRLICKFTFKKAFKYNCKGYKADRIEARHKKIFIAHLKGYIVIFLIFEKKVK